MSKLSKKTTKPTKEEIEKWVKEAPTDAEWREHLEIIDQLEKENPNHPDVIAIRKMQSDMKK